MSACLERAVCDLCWLAWSEQCVIRVGLLGASSVLFVLSYMGEQCFEQLIDEIKINAPFLICELTLPSGVLMRAESTLRVT